MGDEVIGGWLWFGAPFMQSMYGLSLAIHWHFMLLNVQLSIDVSRRVRGAILIILALSNVKN